MAKKNMILLSMEDSKIKKVANVISNDSCRKILDYLSNKDATESELAEKLQLPMSTVHYNLQLLMEAGLVDVEEFHYSPKGREVDHYKLANKYIIIAPKKTQTIGLKQKLKSILPVLLFIAGGTAAVHFLSRYVAVPFTRVFTTTKEVLVRETTIVQQQKAAEMAADKIAESAAAMQAAVKEALPSIANTTEYSLEPTVTTHVVTSEPSIWSSIALWFLIGAIFALAVYFIWKKVAKEPDI
jgi:predicted transcriptional regulator